MGIFKHIKNKIRIELGIQNVEKQVESIHFLLNNCLDITKLPPTKDLYLRKIQKCDCLILAIFDKLCKKYCLNYWLMWGSLLGAVRHKGFIPWDDDVDVCMTRDDIDRVIPLMRNELENFGFTVIDSIRGIWISYGNYGVVWIDVFPVDECFIINNKNSISDAIMKYRTFFWKNPNMKLNELQKEKMRLFSSYPKGNTKYYIPSMETWKGNTKCYIFPDVDIFPLKKIKFEEFEFNVPSNSSRVLEKSYGQNYMDFPILAINSHGKIDNTPLSKRIKDKGVDLDEIYNKLSDINQKI